MKGKESNHPLRHPVLLAMHAALLFTYFGVNLLLGGMHSYAG